MDDRTENDASFGGIWDCDSDSVVFPELERGTELPDDVVQKQIVSRFNREEFQALGGLVDVQNLPYCQAKFNLVAGFYNVARSKMKSHMSVHMWDPFLFYEDVDWMREILTLLVPLIQIPVHSLDPVSRQCVS
jgi:hypothetical protein